MKLSQYIRRSQEIDAESFDKKIKLALLSSFTVNGLEETLRVKCADANIGCRTYVSGYNQHSQEILNDKSELYRFAPDVSFLILDTRSVLGDLFYFPYSISKEQRIEFIKNRAGQVVDLVSHFIKKSDSKIVLTQLSVPTYSPYGICETKTDYGLQEMARDFNKRVTEGLINEPSAYIYDFNSFVTRFGENNVFDYRQFHLGDIKISLDFIPQFADELLGYVKPILGLNRKCIVVDLDNTLWGGVVGEDGFEGIELSPTGKGSTFVEFQRLLLSLQKRGIILAINSKNNPEDALKVIREHPYMVLREENFAALRINWNDKVSNMKEIAEELNIGLDSMVFFDDDPVNREYVRKMLPAVLTVDLPGDSALYAPTLASMSDFNVLKITEEDQKRGEMYLQQRKRNDLEKNTASLDDFLSQLDIKIKIKNADKFTIPRISQLTLKTNQFNLTTHRYQEEEITKFSQDKSMLVGSAQVEDKFGDNGITGTFIVMKNDSKEWTVDTFLLSCRVMGRKVEDAMMSHIINQGKKEGAKKIKAKYIPTQKNRPCETFLADYGFKQNGEYWEYDTSSTVKMPSHIELVAL